MALILTPQIATHMMDQPGRTVANVTLNQMMKEARVSQADGKEGGMNERQTGRNLVKTNFKEAGPNVFCVTERTGCQMIRTEGKRQTEGMPKTGGIKLALKCLMKNRAIGRMGGLMGGRMGGRTGGQIGA